MANGGIIGPVTTIVKSTGGNTVSKFTSPGTFAPGGSGTKLLDVLVVAGGGGGGATKGAPNNSAAGGGGGGLIQAYSGGAGKGGVNPGGAGGSGIVFIRYVK